MAHASRSLSKSLPLRDDTKGGNIKMGGGGGGIRKVVANGTSQQANGVVGGGGEQKSTTNSAKPALAPWWHKCPHCNKAFRHPSRMEYHKGRVHTNVVNGGEVLEEKSASSSSQVETMSLRRKAVSLPQPGAIGGRATLTKQEIEEELEQEEMEEEEQYEELEEEVAEEEDVEAEEEDVEAEEEEIAEEEEEIDEAPVRERSQCPHCPKNYSNLSNLNVHLRAAHKKLLKYNCATCHLNFPSKSKYEAHLATSKHIKAKRTSLKPKPGTPALKEGQSLCIVCMMVLGDRKIVWAHLRKRHGWNSVFQCNECKKFQCTGQKALFAHQRTQHADLFREHCNHCNATFQSSSGLRHHLRNTHGLA